MYSTVSPGNDPCRVYREEKAVAAAAAQAEDGRPTCTSPVNAKQNPKSTPRGADILTSFTSRPSGRGERGQSSERKFGSWPTVRQQY